MERTAAEFWTRGSRNKLQIMEADSSIKNYLYKVQATIDENRLAASTHTHGVHCKKEQFERQRTM
jgi:hypothetical protein